jgi:AcrR family transcriptional regulator
MFPCGYADDVTATTTTIDGRNARRERGRQAVFDAALDLVQETGAPPSPEAVARRAGVSVSSLFRYVDTLDELQEAVIDRFTQRYASLFEIPDLGRGGLDDRIARHIKSRLTQYSTVAPVARLTRSRSLTRPRLAASLTAHRSAQWDQVRHHYEPELSAHSPATIDDLVGSIATLTSFEAWDLLQGDGGRTTAQIKRAWTLAIRQLLG